MTLVDFELKPCRSQSRRSQPLDHAALDNKITTDCAVVRKIVQITSKKRATIIPISKLNKDHNSSTNYQTLSLYHPLPKYETLSPYITKSILVTSHQHGFKHKHLIDTALHNCHQTPNDFNNSRLAQRTVVVALDMSKAFDR